MTWSHRVYHREGVYTIREHYEDADGKCVGYSGPQEPIAFHHEEITNKEDALESLRWQLTMMLKALDQPILEDTQINPLTIKVERDQVLEAFGRAYCTYENCDKLRDFELGTALCDELFGKE